MLPPPYDYALCAAAGVIVSSLGIWATHRMRIGSYRRLAAEMLQKAELESDGIKHETEIACRERALEHQRELEEKLRQEQTKWDREKQNLARKEDKLDERRVSLEQREKEIERKQRSLADAQRSIEETHLRLQGRENALCSELESIAGLTQEEAKAALIERIRSDVQKDAARLTRHIMQQAEDEAEDRCKRLLATTINRLAVPCVAEATVSTVTLPSDEMKGRIIGREGRNIRAFEKATGVTIVIDDTPGAVVVSSFDPVRRHVAKMALGDLLLDGRIHPTRIEEVVQKAQELTAQQIRQYGEDAALRAGVSDLHPALIQLLGRLKFRFSYAQNVLEHSLEVSHLLGMMAAELGLDQAFARRVGLLHDMGKAVSHEMEGTHAVIGHDLALKYGESPEVANGIGCHHGEMEPITIVGSLCGAADAISASRPGARTEAVEEYVKRVRRLESIAGEFPGVENVYALQAGKELRIMVLPDMIDDDGCLNLARDISKRIEGALSYPGQIKVTVIREKRAIHYAS